MNNAMKKAYDEPIVSIIIPSYNSDQFLSETLDSVINQKYKNWECIIVDDGSTDSTESLVKSFVKKDKRFKYIFQENAGPSVARNKAIDNSHGEFILPLDSDDLISEDYVLDAVAVFKKDPEVKLVYCLAELFGELTGKWDLPEYSYEGILFRNCIFCTAMYRKSDFEKTAGYNSNMKKTYEDWDFWLSLLRPDDKVVRIPRVHFFYRIRNKSRNSDISDEELRILYRQLYLNHKDLYEGYWNPLYYKSLVEKLDERLVSIDRTIQDQASAIRDLMTKMGSLTDESRNLTNEVLGVDTRTQDLLHLLNHTNNRVKVIEMSLPFRIWKLVYRFKSLILRYPKQ